MSLHGDHMPHALLHQLCEDHVLRIRLEMLVVVFQDQFIDIDFTNASLDAFTSHFVSEAIRTMQHKSHTALGLRSYRLKPADSDQRTNKTPVMLASSPREIQIRSLGSILAMHIPDRRR